MSLRLRLRLRPCASVCVRVRVSEWLCMGGGEWGFSPLQPFHVSMSTGTGMGAMLSFLCLGVGVYVLDVSMVQAQTLGVDFVSQRTCATTAHRVTNLQ